MKLTLHRQAGETANQRIGDDRRLAVSPSRRFALRPASRAFTLIELMMAVMIFGIVLAAINTVFYGAMRLRGRVTEAVDDAQLLNQATAFLRRDLQGTMPLGGVMTPSFKIGLVSTVVGAPQSQGIEFYSSSGVITDTAPWGDVQKVVYLLREPLDRSRALGKDLVRSISRNLLATATEEPYEQRLMGDVQTLEFLGFNGTDWRSVWDTTMTDTNLPTAIRVRIQLASNLSSDLRNQQPVEMLVPLVMQAVTTQTTGGTQ